MLEVHHGDPFQSQLPLSGTQSLHPFDRTGVAAHDVRHNCHLELVEITASHGRERARHHVIPMQGAQEHVVPVNVLGVYEEELVRIATGQAIRSSSPGCKYRGIGSSCEVTVPRHDVGPFVGWVGDAVTSRSRRLSSAVGYWTV